MLAYLQGCSAARASESAKDAGAERALAGPLRLPTARASGDAFLGESDDLILDRLRNAEPVKIKRGGGGRSLGFKLKFEDGSKAYFKPDQAFSGANWYSEVASYHLDRELGMGRVPPVISRSFPFALLERAAGTDRRVAELHIREDGTLPGALVHWLTESLQPAVTPPGFENWLRVEPFARWSVSPYKRPAEYAKALRHNMDLVRSGKPGEAFYDQTPERPSAEFAKALSDMMILDFLTLNIDRWGGDNANVLTMGDARRLIFLDNGAGFSPGPPTRGLMDDRLAPVQRFRRRTVQALRHLDLARLWARLDGEALMPILSDELREGIAVRRDKVLAHVAAMERSFGDAVYTW